MDTLTIIGIIIFIVMLLFMSVTAGTQESISALSKCWRWVLLFTLLSQAFILPQLIDMTPEPFKFIPFIGTAGIILCGASDVLDKTDELVHMIAAVVAFICLTIWVILINPICLLPLIICSCAGKDKIKWRAEIGLIISVYMTLLIS